MDHEANALTDDPQPPTGDRDPPAPGPDRSARGRRPRRAGLVALAAAGLLVLAAVAVPDGFVLRERRRTGRFTLPSAPSLLRYVVAILAVGAILAAVYGFVLSARGVVDRPRPSWRRRLITLFVVVGIIGMLFLLAAALQRDGEPGPGAPNPTVTPSPGPPEGFARSRGFGVILTVLVLAAATAGAAALLRFRAQDRRPRGDDDDLRRALLGELDAAIARLRSIDDPRAAVIACYAGMERALDVAGLERSPADTPHELLTRVLTERRVAGPNARRLTELFEEAKFSDRAIDTDMRDQAMTALTEVRSQLSIHS